MVNAASPVEPSTQTLEEGTASASIGSPCRSASDCFKGAICNLLTCDFPPCTVQRVSQSQGPSVFNHYFDAKGRSLGYRNTSNGKLLETMRVTWTDDGRVATHERSFGSRPLRIERKSYYNDAGDEVRSVSYGLDGTLDDTRFVHSDSWECRGGWQRVDGKGVVHLRAEPLCNEDGNPIQMTLTHPDGTTQVKTYEYDGAHLSRYTTSYGDKPLLMRFHRSRNGSVARIEMDQGADGTIETQDTYDRSCWEIQGERIQLKQKSRQRAP